MATYSTPMSSNRAPSTPRNAVGRSTNQGYQYYNPQTATNNSVKTGAPVAPPKTGAAIQGAFDQRTPAGGGGGGGGGQPPQSQPNTYRGAGDSANYSFGSEQDFYREIDNAYNPQYDYLNQAESTLKSQYPSVLEEAEAMYKANQGQLDASKQSALGTIQGQKAQATGRYEDALSAARRMYDEMQRGYQNRFGGLSSAAEAANTLLGVESQRQRGQTQRSYNDTMSQIGQQQQEIENNYNANLQQLTAQKTTAINQAQKDFQNKLLEIANNRAMLGQAKAQARLGALQELRQQTYAIEMQNRQFEQQLQMMKEQAQLQIQQYNATTGAATQNTSKALEAFNNSGIDPTTGLRMQTQQRVADPIYIGQIGKSITGRDELGRTIYDDGSKGWTQWQ